jgi:hypothetical protein
VAATADETLADEARRSKQAGAVAIAAGLLTIVSGALAAIVYSDKPTIALIDALREHLSANPPVPGLKVRQALFYDTNAVKVLLVSVLLALAAIAMGLALSHLYRSTKARRPELTRSSRRPRSSAGSCASSASSSSAPGGSSSPSTR